MGKGPGVHGDGFTLLELLLTVALLVVGVVSVVSALSAGVTTDQSVEGQAIALTLAQEEMETLKDSSWASVSAAGQSQVSGFPDYNQEILVSGDDPKEVTVNVYWAFKGVQQKVSLVTLLTNPSP
ncbi:MAG: hypothetical protein HQL24_04435 [Candidatus Omnitrophica bacterium]|nr:hypothetical protein [Candidatus Omnitrophota bacterium]